MRLIVAGSLLVLCLAPSATYAQSFNLASTTARAQVECSVADPTGTPLNVRSRPNGPILGALHNGTPVFLSDLALDTHAQRWAKVVPLYEGRSGWVFRDYLDCQGPLPRKRGPETLAYDCDVPGKPVIGLDLARHRFQIADQEGELHEDNFYFNFTTRLGYTVTFDLGDPDNLQFDQPARVVGSVVVEKDGRAAPPLEAVCSRR